MRLKAATAELRGTVTVFTDGSAARGAAALTSCFTTGTEEKSGCSDAAGADGTEAPEELGGIQDSGRRDPSAQPRGYPGNPQAKLNVISTTITYLVHKESFTPTSSSA
jgi:hypothetical protein